MSVMGTAWVRYPCLDQPSVAKRAESGQTDIIVPMVTVQMGVEGTVLRRVEFLAVRVQEDSAQSSLHAERET